MIRYALRCSKAHVFESWFASSDAFDKQAKRGLIACPVCGDEQIEKAIMAPRIKTTDVIEQQASAADEPAPAPVVLMDPQAQAMRALVRAFRAHVMEKTDDVGKDFAEEARRIHYGEAEHRLIRGEATRDEVEDLRDEGVDVMPIPQLPDERN